MTGTIQAAGKNLNHRAFRPGKSLSDLPDDRCATRKVPKNHQGWLNQKAAPAVGNSNCFVPGRWGG